jgi:hypothetical protein
MEENLDFLGRDAMPSNIPQVNAMDVPDFGYAGEVINTIIPSDLTTLGIDDVKYYSGNAVNKTIKDQDTAQRVFENAIRTGAQPNPEISGYSNPVDYNKNQTSYDRYYNHPKFKDLGFSPFRDNESLYNQNATWGDEYSRMFGQFGKLFTTGFTSSFESLGDVIGGTPAKLFDESAGDYSKAAEIGMTTKGGVLGFTNNLILNSGYTIGILSEIALEELALGALTVGTGGVGAGAAAARTGQNLGKLSRIGEMFQATRNFVNGLDKAGDARRFWDSAGKFLNPFENTVDAYRSIKQLNTGKNAVYRLDNVAKATKYFGSFYRDIRNINAALGESKLEGGMVRDEVYKDLINEYKENNNFTLPEGQDHEAILDQAQKAGFETEMINLPLIFFSNKLAFDNILNGYKPLQKVLKENSGIVGDSLRKTTVKGVPQYVRKKLTDVVTLPFTDPKAALKSVLGTGARYSMTNLTEGLQELAQETISDTYKNFYINSFKDPSLVHKNYMSTSLKESINRQVFSSQGMETFLSGFLMGGVAGPFGNFMYKTLPAAGKYLTNKEEYVKYKAEKEKIIVDTQKKLNDALANPFKVFSLTDENLVTQKALQKKMEEAAAKGEQLEFQDAKDEALFTLVNNDLQKSKELQALAETGELDTLKDHVEKLSSLSDEEFKQAYGFSAEEKGKKIQETLNRIDSLKNASQEIEERFGGNPFRPELYKPNSAAFINELQQYRSWEAAKSHLLYQMYAQNRAVERKADLLESAINTPLFQGMAASDFNIMFDPRTLDAEVDLLAEEIKNMGEVTDPQLKKELEFKKKKEALLRNYKSVYEANLKKDGTYDMRKVNKIYNAFRDYLDLVKNTKSPKEIISDPAVQEVFSKLFDYKVLDTRQQILEQSINILMDPNYFKQLADRLTKVTTDAFNKVKEDLNKTLADHMDLLEKNDVLASLKEMGVLVEPEEALAYLKKGTIPKTFYHESVLGPVTPQDPIFGPIAQLFAIKEAKDAAEKQSQTKPADPKQAGQDPNDFTDVEEGETVEDVSNFTMSVINRLYEEYVATVPEVETIQTKEEFFQRKKIQDIVKAIGELEKTYNDITTDKPEFEEWLVDNKSTDKVQNILLKYNLAFNDIFKRTTDPTSFNTSSLGEDEKLESQGYKGVFVVSIMTEDGTPVYTVVDNNNVLIENVDVGDNQEDNIKVSMGPYFDNLNTAIEVQKIIGDYLERSKQDFTFEGVSLKYGDILNDGNNEYIVLTKPEDIEKDPTTLNIKNIKTGSVLSLKSLSGFAKGSRSTFDKSNFTSKLRTLNPINKMWGARLPNETQQDANERLSQLLINTSLVDLVKGLTIRFSKTDSQLERYSYLQLDDQKVNQNFGFFKDPFAIEVLLNGETIGYLPNPTSSAFLDSQGNPININNVSVDKFKQAFYTTGSYVRMLDQYKASYRNKLALFNYLKNKLGNKESIEVSFNELSKNAKVNLLNGEYDWTDKADESIKLSDLNFYTVDGGVYIINREKKYNNGIMTDVEALPITDLPVDKLEALNKEINDLRFGEGIKDPLLNAGRYVAVVRLPNGKLRFVELTSNVLTEIEQNEFVEKLVERIAKSKAENINENNEAKAMEFNDVWNKNNINDKLFIALPVSKRGQFISFTLTPKGGIQLDFLDKTKTIKGQPLKRTVYIENPEISTFNDLLATLNNAIKKHDENPKVSNANKINIILTKDNFKQSISKTASVQDFLQLSSNVGPNIVKSVSLTITMEDQPSDVEVDPLNLPVDPTDGPVVPGNIDMSSAPQGNNAITPDLLRGTAPSNPKPEVSETTEDPLSKVLNRQKEAEEAMAEKKAKDDTESEDYFDNIIDQIKNLENQIDDEIEKIRKDLISKAGTNVSAAQKKQIRIDAENAPSVKALKEQLRNLERKLPFKIVDAGYTPSDIANINDFVTWVKNNLPDFITVDDLNTLANNIIKEGKTVGAFVQGLSNIAGKVEVNGTIYVGADTPFKYHEAFHAVFRLLLSDTQIDKYLSIAKKEVRDQLRKEGKTLSQALQEIRELHPMYMRMSQSDLEERFYEEYLADKFDAWKTNKKTETSFVNKSLFAKIIDFIKKILGVFSKNELQTLFESIDAGKFRNTKVVSNRFTDENNPSDVSVPVLKAIKIGDELIQDTIFTPEGEVKAIKVPKYLPEQEGTRLTAAIANQFVSALEKASIGKSEDDLLEEILNKYEDLYDTDRDEYADLSQKEFKKVKDYKTVFSKTENREILKEAVYDHLSFISKKYVAEQDTEEEIADELGDRGKQNYTDGSENIGGFSSLSKYLRSWIATVSYHSEDQFGNKYFLDGTPYIEAVDASRVYAGILKAVSNTESTVDMVIRLNVFKDQSPEAGKVISKFFEETNVSFDEDGQPILDNVTNSYLFQSFIKGFGQYSYRYTFLNKDIFKGEVDILDANRKSPGKVQMELWSSAFTDLYSNKVENNPALKQKALNAIASISSAMSASKQYTDDQLKEISSRLASQLADVLGIAISPLYLSYSIAANISNRTKNQDTLFGAYSNIEPISIESLNQLYKLINDNEDPFINTIVEEQTDASGQVVEVEVFRGGVTTRLEKIATANSIFDESVMPAVWTNAEGKTVYAHQLPSYHAVKLIRLQKENGLDNEVEQDAFLQDNPIIKTDRFRQVLKNLTIGRIDGQKVSTLNRTENGLIENKQLEKNKRDGVTFGSYSPAEFITTLIDLYQKGNIEVIGDESFATSTHLIRVLEASSTGNIIEGMPLIKAVKIVSEDGGYNLTEEAKNILLDFVKQEYNRISKIQQEIISGEPLSEEHLGYNVPDSKGNIRGLQLFKTGVFLDPSFKQELEQQAKDQKPLTSKQESQIKSALERSLLKEVNEIYQILQDENIIQLNDDKEISRTAISSFINKGFTKQVGKKTVDDKTKNSQYNIAKNNPRFNLAQIYINDFINTTTINQLMHGDHALSFKDGVDEVKRAKGDNASGQSAATEIIDSSLGIKHKFNKMHVVTFNDPTIYGKYKKGKVEVADGQTWLTTKALRYILFGLGKLSPTQAKLLDKIEKGEKLTGTEFFGEKDKKGFVSFDATTNSIKLVYFDGKKYLKTSAIVLTKQLTSYGEGFSKALPGREELHELREKLEAYENVEGRETVGIAVPASASKMLKTNVASSVSEISDKNFIEFDPNFLRLQQENPSNKIKITDPTQIKQILMAEQDDETIVDFMGKEITVKELKEVYQKTSIARVSSNYLFKRNEIFTLEDAIDEVKKSIDRNKVTPKLEVFQKYAVERLKESAADAQMIEFFEVGEDGIPKYNLNNPLTMDKFAQLFLAYFSKGVLSEKIPGHSVALVSSYGNKKLKKVLELDEEGQPKRWEIVRDDEFLLNPEQYGTPKKYSDNVNRLFNNLEVGDYYVDDLRHNVPEYDENGKITGYFTEFIMPAHFKDVYDNIKPGDKISDAIAKMFGVRIPSQDKHSAVNLKLVDFMPVYYGSSAVFAPELIEISGADFDIDKLYIAIKEFYTQKKNGKVEFVEYGGGKTDTDKFNQFVKYQFSKNKDFRKAYHDFLKAETERKEQFEEDLNLLDLDSDFEDSLDYFDLNSEKIEYFIDKKEITKSALQFVGLPSTSEEYTSKVKQLGYEPYNGALNNTIVDARMALFGNENMTTVKEGETAPKAFQVASTKALEDVVQEFKTLFGEQLKDQLEEGRYNVDTLLGKYYAFKNNKEGARNIGPAVNSLLVYTLLNQNNINIRKNINTEERQETFRFRFNDNEFSSYGQTRAYNKSTGKYTGERILDSISTLISAMTDNAKERLAAKLNLNINSLGIVANMIAQGVTLRDSLLFINQPIIREFYKLLAKENSSYSFTEIKMSKNKIIAGLTKQTEAESLNGRLNDLILEENMKNPSDQVNNAVLNDFKLLMDQADSFLNIATIMKVNKGLPTNLSEFDTIMEKAENLGYSLNDENFEKSSIPVDVRKVLDDSEQTVGFNFKVYQEISSLTSTIMLQRTPVVKKLKSVIEDNFNINFKDKETFNDAFDKNVVSYFAIKAYINFLKNNQSGRALASLNNGMIYDETASTLPDNMDSVVDVVNKIREVAPKNYFANNFIFAHNAAQLSNKDNINKVTANTWAKLNKLQVNKLQYSLMELYNNSITRPYVVDLFHYLLVKDGGQFKSDSFIRVMPNFIFDNILKQAGNAVKYLMQEEPNNVFIKSTFGASLNEMFNEFIKGYTSASSNSFYIKKYNNLNLKTVNQIRENIGLDKVKDSKTIIPVETKFKKDSGSSKEVRQLEINMFKNVSFTSEFEVVGLSEIFDSNTNKLVTVEQVRNIPGTNKMTDEGKLNFRFNMSYLRLFGLDTSRAGGDNPQGIGFPLVIKRTTKDELTLRTITSYYKLSKIKKDRKFISGDLLINEGDSFAYGTEAVYDEIDLQGSYKQFAAGFVIPGNQPTAKELSEKKKALRKAAKNKGGFNLDAVADNAVSTAAIDAAIAQIDQIGFKPRDLKAAERNSEQPGIDYMLELSKLGIDVVYSNGKITYLKDGKPYNAMGATSPRDLYEKLAPTPTEIDFLDKEYSEEQGPSDDLINSIALNRPVEIPAIDLGLLREKQNEFPGLLKFYSELTDEQINKLKSEYKIKSFVDLTDQFVLSQSESNQSEKEFIDQIKQCYL